MSWEVVPKKRCNAGAGLDDRKTITVRKMYFSLSRGLVNEVTKLLGGHAPKSVCVHVNETDGMLGFQFSPDDPSGNWYGLSTPTKDAKNLTINCSQLCSKISSRRDNVYAPTYNKTLGFYVIDLEKPIGG